MCVSNMEMSFRLQVFDDARAHAHSHILDNLRNACITCETGI